MECRAGADCFLLELGKDTLHAFSVNVHVRRILLEGALYAAIQVAPNAAKCARRMDGLIAPKLQLY